MSIKPILFNTDMVRAILDGRKTATRRVCKPQPYEDDKKTMANTQPYRPGDILYVRETWQPNPYGIGWPYFYKASPEGFDHAPDKWRPSIHMPREAARIFLRVTDVRVERLQEMADEDLVRDFGFCWEAIQAVGRDALAKPFWDSTIKSADRALYGWAANPWAWVIEFERCEKPEEECS